MDILGVLKLLREIGLLKVAKAISSLAWIILPFWIWLIVLEYFGKELFIFPIAMLGIAFFLLELVFSSAQIYFTSAYGLKTLKIIGKIGSAFRDPRNQQLAENFKNACRKSILPFIHGTPLSLSAMSGILRSRKILIMSAFVGLYVSYSFITFIVSYQRALVNFFSPLTSCISTIFSADLINWPFQHMWISLAILWALSLYHEPLIRMARAVLVPKYILITYTISLLNVASRITIIFGEILSLPVTLTKRRRSVVYEPFIDPLNLPRIIQKMVQNVEGKSCNVSRWSEEINTEAQVSGIMESIQKDENFPLFAKILVRFSRSKDYLSRIEQTQPMTYLGIQDHRCVFLGVVVYNPIEKIRSAVFYFDTIYLKQEFVHIYGREAEKQRQIVSELPSKLEGLLRGVVKE